MCAAQERISSRRYRPRLLWGCIALLPFIFVTRHTTRLAVSQVEKAGKFCMMLVACKSDTIFFFPQPRLREAVLHAPPPPCAAMTSKAEHDAHTHRTDSLSD